MNICVVCWKKGPFAHYCSDHCADVDRAYVAAVAGAPTTIGAGAYHNAALYRRRLAEYDAYRAAVAMEAVGAALELEVTV